MSRALDPRKDVVVSFMELAPGFPDFVASKVFENLGREKLIQSLADSMIKSPIEFNKVFNLLLPAFT